MAKNQGGPTLGILEVQKVVRKNEACALDLVNDNGRGKGGHMEDSVPLEAGAGPEGGM